MNKRREVRRAEGLPTQAADLLVLAADFALLTLLALQAAVAGCLLLYGSLPLPASWSRAALERAGLGELRLDYGDARLGLRGVLRLSQPQLFIGDSESPFLEAEHLVIRLRWPGNDGLLAPDLDSLVVTGGTFYLPALHSPDGHRKPILERGLFKLVLDADRLRVEPFAALHREIRLRGALSFPRGSPAEKPLAPREQLDRIFALAGEAVRATGHLDGLETPTLFFDLQQDEHGDYDGRLALASRSYEGDGVSAERPLLETRLNIRRGAVMPDSPVGVSARRLSFPEDDLEIETVSAEIKAGGWDGSFRRLSGSAQLAAASLRKGDIDLEAPVLTIASDDSGAIRFSGFARGFRGAFTFAGESAGRESPVRVRAFGDIDFPDLLPAAVRQAMPAIRFDAPPFGRIDLLLSKAFDPEEASFALQTGPGAVGETGFNTVSLRGRYAGEVAEVDDFLIRRHGQWLAGRLRLGRADGAYRAELRGSIQPEDYDDLMPSWWGRVFKDIDVGPPGATRADFVLHGRAGDRDSRFFYGSVEGSRMAYSGVPIDAARLKVRGRGLYVELFDLEAAGPAGRLSGDMAWTSRPDDVPSFLSSRFNLESRLSINALCTLVGEETAAILDGFDSNQPPLITVAGTLFESEYYPAFSGLDQLRVETRSDGRIAFHGVPFDSLAFTLDVVGRESYLRELDFHLAGGHGTGAIDLYRAHDGTQWMRARLKVLDANHHVIVEELGFPDGRPEDGEAPPPTRLDVALHAEGPVDDPAAATGFGRFRLDDPGLGAVQLLGPLSRMLQNTAFGFTTLDLERASGSFAIDNRRLDFKTFEVDGPTIRISGSGQYGLDDRSLAFRVHVRPFGGSGSKTPLGQVTRVLSPLSGILSFQLLGTFDKPRWRSLFDPRNLVPGL